MPIKRDTIVNSAKRVRGGQGIKQTKLISLAKSDAFCQEVVAFFRTRVLSIGAIAALHRRSADALRDRLLQDTDRRYWTFGSEFLARGANQVIDRPLPILECCVILGNFAFAVVSIPSVNLDRNHEI